MFCEICYDFSRFLYLDLDTFHEADLDPVSQNETDPDPKHCFKLNTSKKQRICPALYANIIGSFPDSQESGFGAATLFGTSW